jgi:hypothetical protein
LEELAVESEISIVKENEDVDIFVEFASWPSNYGYYNWPYSYRIWWFDPTGIKHDVLVGPGKIHNNLVA